MIKLSSNEGRHEYCKAWEIFALAQLHNNQKFSYWKLDRFIIKWQSTHVLQGLGKLLHYLSCKTCDFKANLLRSRSILNSRVCRISNQIAFHSVQLALLITFLVLAAFKRGAMGDKNGTLDIYIYILWWLAKKILSRKVCPTSQGCYFAAGGGGGRGRGRVDCLNIRSLKNFSHRVRRWPEFVDQEESIWAIYSSCIILSFAQFYFFSLFPYFITVWVGVLFILQASSRS